MYIAFSAAGHVAYMVVRMGPVFRLGSFYFDTNEKIRWCSLTDYQRFQELITLRSTAQSYLALELSLLFLLSTYFISLSMNLMFIRAHTFVDYYYSTADQLNILSS